MFTFIGSNIVPKVVSRHNGSNRYIEDITWPRGDTKFLFVLKNIPQNEKRNFVSLSDHVILFLLYKILTILNSLFQKLRFHISLQSVVYLYQS